MTTTYVDYIGRSVDVLAYWLPGQDSSGLLTLELLAQGEGGRIVTGVQKLAQRFLMRMLTIKGSVKHWPDQGTYFMSDLLTGRIRSLTDLASTFAMALSEIQQQSAAEELQSDPDDEKLSTAELVSAEFLPDGVSLTIRVTSVSGSHTEFIAPLTLAP